MSLINPASATMSFVAHIDDDFLFQNPDIQESITAGGGHTTVYLTAGDAGLSADHWQAREAGAKTAYSEMAGVNDWVDSVATFGNAESRIEVQTSYLESQPEVRLYFLRLPDGYQGTGYDVTGNQSLERLWESEIDSVSSMDGANTVSANQLSGLLLGLMNHHQPDEILLHDHSSEYVESSHSDHVSASLFAYDARQYYSTDHEAHSYIDYATATLASNQTPEESERNLEVYQAYLRGYHDESDPEVVLPVSRKYLSWTSRNYQIDDVNLSDSGLSETQTFTTLDFLSEEIVANDIDSVLGSEGDDGLVVPCFTPGTLIATARGELRVEELEVGDRVITRDNGMQKIRWLGLCEMSVERLSLHSHLRPILIRRGALGNNQPERDMMVSPQHRILIANENTSLYFDAHEVLIPAKHLTDIEGVEVANVPTTTYIHVMFDNHEMILSDGIWTESFQPGNLCLASMADASRKEIIELFPDLGMHQLSNPYIASRRSLRKYEAQVLTGATRIQSDRSAVLLDL